MCPEMARNLVLRLLLLMTPLGSCTYRSIHISNADVCKPEDNNLPFQREKNPVLNVGEGAIIFQLSDPPPSLQKNIRSPGKLCEIQIEAPENHGIMAYVEEMHMRKSSKDGKCIDFVQFGRNDMIPFFTLRKSNRLCGEMNGKTNVKNGYGFNDADGSLLIWINLGARRETSHWPYISVVNLTLVVTSYRKSCKGDQSGKFRSCDSGSGGQTAKNCIRRDFFCDHHFNCPFKGNASGLTNDELGCQYATEITTPASGPEVDGGFSIKDLNLISWTLIIVCTSLVLSLFVLVFCRARKMRARSGTAGKCFCCCGTRDRRESCEFSEHQFAVRSVAELSSMRQGNQQQNLYLPLSVFNSQNPAPEPVASNLGIPEEAPPAYHEIFPDGAPPSLNLDDGATNPNEEQH